MKDKDLVLWPGMWRFKARVWLTFLGYKSEGGVGFRISSEG